MKDRDCMNCVRNTPEKGCTAWDCDYINRAEAIEAYKRTRWIPVTEKLPEEFGQYLVSSDGYVLALEYGSPVAERWEGTDMVFEDGSAFGEDWGSGDGCEMDNLEKVDAWMPLPEPYKNK